MSAKEVHMEVEFPPRRQHRLLASLMPRRYSRFMLIRLVGYLAAAIVATFCFFLVTAVLAGQYDQAVSLALVAGCVATLIHDILARSQLTFCVGARHIEFKNATVTSTALAVYGGLIGVFFLVQATNILSK